MGGVGSWTAEALARSGVGALTLVDLDVVCVTNVNRQVLATDASVGASKADTMAARVRDINPLCDVTIVRDFVSEENVEAILGLENLNRNRRDDVPYKTIDFVVDAIDAEKDKAAVIACCVHHRVPVITVGGAGGVDALGDVVVEDLSRATFNRLCQRVRRLLRRDYAFPRGEERTPREIYGVRSSFKKGNEGDSKRETKARGKGRKKPQGKFGVKAVYHRENVNFFKPDPGTRGRGGMGCDGVGGSAVFVTGALGFKAASHVCLALMDDDEGRHVRRRLAVRRRRDGGRGCGPRVAAKEAKEAAAKEAAAAARAEEAEEEAEEEEEEEEEEVDEEEEEMRGGEGVDDGGGSPAEEVQRESTYPAATQLCAAAGVAAVAANLEDGDVGARRRAMTMGADAVAAAPRAPRTRPRRSPPPPPRLPASAIFDGHCHWHLGGDLSACVALASSLRGAAFTSTRPDDWEMATACARGANVNGGSRGEGFGLCLGLHPWWAHHHPPASDPTWLPDLRRRLERSPRAVVGEIGLDRVAVPMNERGEVIGEPDYPNQVACFESQLLLATELQRPCVVHCVKAYGDVADRFRAAASMPPRVLMHSFGGTRAYMESLTRMKRWGKGSTLGSPPSSTCDRPRRGRW